MDGFPQKVERRELIRLALLLLPIFVFYALAALRNHALYGTTGFDLAIFDQGLWHASRFETPTSTVRGLPSILGDHWHPAILLLSPLYWIGDGTRNLLVAQPLVTLLGAFPVFLFARRRMDSSAATLWALAYSVSWGIGRGVAFDFHELALAAPALAWTIERWDARDDRGFWIAAFMLLMTKEDQSLTLAMFGFLGLIRRDGWRSLAPPIVGVGWFLLATRILIPWAAEGRAYEHWVYGHLAATPSGVIAYLLTHPIPALRLLFVPGLKVTLWVRTFGTWALLPLLSPYALLVAPSLLSRLLSGEEIHWFSLFHYSMPAMAVLACAGADGVARLERRFGGGERLRLGFAMLAFALCVGIYRGAEQLKQIRQPKTSPEEARALDALLARIPSQASVTTDNRIAPHLSKRRWILQAEDVRPFVRTEWIVWDPVRHPELARTSERVDQEGEYDLVARAGTTRLLRRKPGIASDLPLRPQDLPSYLPGTLTDPSSTPQNRTPR